MAMESWGEGRGDFTQTVSGDHVFVESGTVVSVASGLGVSISGQWVYADVEIDVSSGLAVVVQSGVFVNISGQTVVADIETVISSGVEIIWRGVQVSGAVQVSGTIIVTSGAEVIWRGVQVSGTVAISGTIITSISGQVVESQSYENMIAEQKISVSGTRSWSKIGWNPGMAAAVEEDLIPQGGIYVFPVTPQQMMIKSAATGDRYTAPLGSGAWSLNLYYLDSGYIQRTETIVMNGTSGVNTAATDIYRVNNLRVASVGGAAGPMGNISLTDLSGTVTYGYISSGQHRQRQIIYTVPASGTLYIDAYNISANTAANKYTKFTTRANYDEKALTYTSGFWQMYHEILTVDSPWHQELVVPTKLIQKTDLKVSAYCESAGVVTCALRGYIVGGATSGY